VSSCVQLYERSCIEIFRQFRPAPLQSREGADDGSRWRGPDRPPWLSCREKEWVRRLGASPPMRMSASWFGSSTHRIQGRGAIDPRPESGLPSDRHPDRTKRAVVLGAVKVWPGKRGVRRKVGATANLDSSCARRLCNTAARGEETGLQVEQRNRSRKKDAPLRNRLTKKAPYKGGLH
jgi:hypothetical protein